MISIKQDMHIHSTFSDGIHSIEENISQAEKMGLTEMCCVDHVRESTDWINDFANVVNSLKKETDVKLYSGLETKLLNTAGKLDIPSDVSEIDFVYVADHQFPLDDGPHHPKEIRKMIKDGVISKEIAINKLAEATSNAMKKNRKVVLAHLFSILPKIGMDESEVSEEVLIELAQTAKQTGARIEVDERWKCPSFRTVSVFQSYNVPVIFSSDSHRKETIGDYKYNQLIYERLVSYSNLIH